MSIVKLNALSGGMGEGPPAYLLQIDDFRFLLDCGLDERGDITWVTQHLHKYLGGIDAVLLSHSDMCHLGALPYLVGRLGLGCPIYATIPTFKMGQMFMYDAVLNRQHNTDFNLFNLDDVDAAFDKILQLEYNTPISLKGKGLGITITALPAGHSLGGTAWRIGKQGEPDILYAIDHNNKKERHLNGLELTQGEGPRPGLLVTNALNALYVQEKRRKRDELLLGKMQETVRAGGNVLIASDTAGRSLELILMLDQMWRLKDSNLAPFSLVFLNNVAYNVLEFAKSQVDWMSEKLIKAFESTRKNPFSLKNVTVCHSLIELSQIPAPKVVVTSGPDLEYGFSRDLFLQWCQDPLSTVVLTYRTSPGTLARTLIEGVPRGTKMDLEVRQRVRVEQEEELGAKGEEKEDEDDLVIDLAEDEEEVDEIMEVKTVNNNHHPMDNPPKRRRFDDYGEVIRADDFREKGTKRKISSDQKKASLSLATRDPPTKILSLTQTFSINSQVVFIDFEGRSDVEAVLKLFQEIQPEKLVLVRGTPQSTVALQTMAQKLLPNTKIFRPALRKVLDLSVDSSRNFQVKLTDPLTSSLSLQKVRDYSVAWVDGTVREADSTSGTDDLSTNLVLSPLEDSEPRPSHAPFVVHRLRISELRQMLANNGIKCEIKNGTIHCKCENGMVYITKDSETKSIQLECDGLPDEFYTIRNLLYGQIAIL